MWGTSRSARVTLPANLPVTPFATGGIPINTVQLRDIVETVLNNNKKSNSGVRLPTPPNSSFITN